MMRLIGDSLFGGCNPVSAFALCSRFCDAYVNPSPHNIRNGCVPASRFQFDGGFPVVANVSDIE
ncbi:hypothetical protein T8A63_19950 (plasmid) [Sulfitobacter sp. OXR-159]|uniref:hypothetical protein n=1 Tax=Sulfitobacter sp. OXR-159 TaxID=3100174 RepID=UPI002AC8FF2B|nr:hypothetical protein [Sulfitobacter sp. OXR-159]WPZ31604.1 hypothetical protein T8A63_19950 [Sulfitobacter sp. OXR-159]